MLKRILLALDGSQPGIKAQEKAIKLASEHKASITALGIIDTPWITAPQPEPLGGSAFKIHRDEAIIRQSREHVQSLFRDFETRCKSENINCHHIEAEGFPSILIERLSHEHDLIVIGKTTDFHFDLDENTDITVKHVARDNPRPLIIVPEDYMPDDGPVLITKDGSLAASKALHMFLLLGLGKNRSVEVLSINPDGDLARLIAGRGLNMCESHEVKASSHVIETEDNEAQIILDYARQKGVSMIVMGGFSRSILKEAFFGSCSKSILKDSNIPLFIHH